MQPNNIELVLLVNELTKNTGSDELQAGLAAVLQDDNLSDRTKLRRLLDLCFDSEQESAGYRVSLAHLVKSVHRRCRLPARFKERCDEILSEAFSLDYDAATQHVKVVAVSQTRKRTDLD